MTYITCRLTAKNWDQLRNPTLGNRVWATFTFLLLPVVDFHRPILMRYVMGTFIVGGGHQRVLFANQL